MAKIYEVNKMRILFIHPMPPSSLLVLQKITYHYGIGSIAAVLKQHGHQVKYHAFNKFNGRKIAEILNEYKPGLVGITVNSNQFDLAQKITNFIAEEFQLPVILGGVHATVCPEETINIKGAFGICIGEGEYPTLELANLLEENPYPLPEDLSIKNFWFKYEGEIIKNSLRPLIQDLDSLPYCDREIIDFKKLLNYHKYLEIRATRGCPYRCSFCVSGTYQQIYNHLGRYYRTRSANNILEEIELLRSKFKQIRSIVFDDELMTVNKKWAIDFFEKYKEKVNLPFNLTIRANLVDEDFIRILKEVGCNTLMMGVENGDDFIRNEVLKKGITTEEIINAAEIIKKYGIKLWTFNMIGVPYETPETIKKTIKLNRKIKTDIVFVSTFYPYPGIPLEKLCREKGWISNRKVEGFFSNVTVLDQPSITKEEVAYYHNIFPWEILYPQVSFLIKLLAKIKITKKRSIYDLLLPLVKTIYEIYYRFKITLRF